MSKTSKTNNILLFDQYMQEQQNEHQQTKDKMSAICCMCGKEESKLYCAVKGDKWVLWREVYKTERRRFLCDTCVKTFKPDVTLSLERRDKNKIKLIPVTDYSGNLLPHTKRIQMDLLPQTFPMSYCGDLNIIGKIVTFEKLSDCTVLKIIPKPGQEYYMDIFIKMYGYIYVTLSKNYKILPYVQFQPIQFQTFYDGNFKRSYIQFDRDKFITKRDMKNVTDS